MQKTGRSWTDPELSASIGAWLRQERQKRSLKLEDLAEQARLTHTAISRVEIGRSAVTVFFLCKVLNALGLNFSALVEEGFVPSHTPNPDTHFRHLDDQEISAADISAYIRREREQRGLTLRAAGEMLRMTFQTLHRLEHNFNERVKLADILNLDTAFALQGELIALVWMYFSRRVQALKGDKRVTDEEVSAPNDARLWTTEDVARYLQINPETVRAMTRRGELPAVKVGHVWRYFSDALMAYLREHSNA